MLDVVICKLVHGVENIQNICSGVAMATSTSGDNNSYEDARRKRLEENRRRFQDLGILNISKTLTEIIKPKKKIMRAKPMRVNIDASELRRSSRERNRVSYNEKEFLLNIFKSSSTVTTPLKESKQHCQKPKSPRKSTIEYDMSQLRRSSRSRNLVSYKEEVSDDDKLEASSDDDQLEASSGDEQLEVSKGNEQLEALSGNERLEASHDDDQLEVLE